MGSRVTDTLEHFLEPTFETRATPRPTDSAEWVGLAAGGIISIASIYVAYVLYVRRRGVTPSCATATAACTLPRAQVVLRRAL